MKLINLLKDSLTEVKDKKPSSGLSKKEKSDVVKKAKKGEDFGKKGKGFKDVVAKAKKSGAKDPEAVAGAAFWKNIKREGAEGKDHEVSMAKNSLKSIAKSVMDLMQKLGDEERDIPGWIQDHITNAENFIDQAAQGFHELGGHDEEDDDDSEESEMIQPVDENKDRNSIYYNDPYRKINAKLPTQKDNTGQKMALELSKKYTPIKSDDLPLDKYLASIGKTIVDIKDLESIDEKKTD